MSFSQPFRDYEILERLGAGAMGTVFKARHKKLGRIVALKVLRPSLARNERFVDRLRREARIVASLNHPNIVTGYDLGEEGGYHFFVMEYVEGQSLRQLLSEWGMFPEDQVLNVALQVAEALDHAYQKGVIHRDVKPGNILIDDEGRVKLTDMGLAKGPADLTLTRDGATVGTPQYISPEQARNPQEVDIRSDLYSLGATLYHMATGQAPFQGESMAEVITKVLHDHPPSATELNPRLSDGLSLVIRKLLAKDIDLRYQTPAELIADLRRVARDEAPAVDRGRLEAAASGHGRRARPWLLGLTAAILVPASVGLGFLLRGGGPERPAADQQALQRIDQRLAGLPRPSARLSLLSGYERDAAPALREPLRLRRDRILAEVQSAVDRVVETWLGPRRDELSAWVHDVATWPDAEQFERQWLTPELLQEADFRPDDLPQGVRRDGLQELRELVRSLIQRRDEGLLARFGDYLRRQARSQWLQRLQARDFAGAEAAIGRALEDFFDGESLPAWTRLAPAVRKEAERLHRAALAEARQRIERAEAALIEQMRSETDAALAELEAELETPARDPAPVALEADRLRDDLRRRYPEAGRFRPEHDPWPALQARWNAFEARLRLAEADWQKARLETRLAFAYRALERGSPRAALEFLADLSFGQDALEERLQRHRQWLAAAAAVLDPVLSALRSSQEPLWARLRADPITRLELRLSRDPSGLPLQVRPPGGSFHEVALSDLIVGDLLRQAERLQPGLLAELPAEVRERGRQLLAWLSDDLSAVPANASRFAVEELLPALARARAGRHSGPPAEDPRLALERVLRAQIRAASTGETAELEEALAYYDRHHAQATLEGEEARQLEESRSWLRAERRRRSLLRDLEAGAPRGAAVAAAVARQGLQAEVTLDAPALRPLAAEAGWELREGELAFRRSGVRLADLVDHRLDVACGLPSEAPVLTCTLELILPAGGAGQRLWLFEFQGLLLAVALRGDDSVVAALTEPVSLSRPEILRRALRGALEESLHAQPARVVPGAVHRLQLESLALPGRAGRRFRAMLDGRELVRADRVEHEASAQAILRLYPMHPIRVRRMAFAVQGL